MAPRYVLRWHKELGAIYLSAELCFIQKIYLPCGRGFEPHGRCFLIFFFVFVTFLCFFLLSIFFVYVADLDVLIYFSSSFIFVTDLFIRPNFFIQFF
jgi:hypothetical protein